MRFTADSNILLRATTGDDLTQSPLAKRQLDTADVIAITLPALCEFVWVLSSGYKAAPARIAEGIRRLLDSDNVVTDRPAVDAGLAILDAGGDFADGVIAFEGRRLGGEAFLTFDRKAAKLVAARGGAVQLLC